MAWFSRTPAEKVAKVLKSISKVRADFTLLQEGLKQPLKITPRVIARFENNVAALRGACNSISNVISPEVFASVIEQLELLEKRSSELSLAIRDPTQVRVKEFGSFRVALQMLEHLLNEERKRLSTS